MFQNVLVQLTHLYGELEVGERTYNLKVERERAQLVSVILRWTPKVLCGARTVLVQQKADKCL